MQYQLSPEYSHIPTVSNYTKIVTLSAKINHLANFVKNEIIIPAESPFLADHNDTFTFWIGLTVPKLRTSKYNQYTSLICDISNAYKCTTISLLCETDIL